MFFGIRVANKRLNIPFNVLWCPRQVELSLQSSFQPGMKLEVANKSSPDTYWVATIITTCGQLLLLRYSGYGEDRKADFWCDVMTAELHPVGWCAQNNKTLMPPEGRKKLFGTRIKPEPGLLHTYAKVRSLFGYQDMVM